MNDDDGIKEMFNTSRCRQDENCRKAANRLQLITRKN